MGSYTIRICDMCGSEQDTREKIRWSSVYGQVILSFKNYPGVQRDYSQKLICLSCAEDLESAIVNVISKKEKEKEVD